ncbi:MAG: type IV pilus twitching motility protein PilT [Planctomycetes bacterium]|nr:type IV pilus twitching motility protein PilT [Planctomycetota bacterium]
MPNIKELMKFCAENNASDLHLSVGRPPVVRQSGRLKNLEMDELTPGDIEAVAAQIVPERLRHELQELGSCDFASELEGVARFRCSVFHQQGHTGVVMRLIPSKLLSFEQIGLPEHVKDLLVKPRGLILVTGPTGSGKTTTLATMIDYVNANYDRHIITIEDPIEYRHPHKKSLITQREVGTDTTSFAEAMRRALRQDPDIIMLGEMRDLETISTAITAAETGHLVFGTLHTTGAARTLDRIIDSFPPDQQEQVRQQLAGGILSIISQVLIPRVDRRGVVAAFEVMINTPAIENHMRKGETYKIFSEIQTGKRRGMRLLDEHLYELYGAGAISDESALAMAQRTNEMREKIGH